MSDSTTTPTPKHGLSLLCLTALGVVYGDIGTSPLYALRECFGESHDLPVNHDNVLGVLSLIFWSLILVVSFKYLVFILRADNRGEGGILALTALLMPIEQRSNRKVTLALLVALGIFGAAMLYGDGMITPAISVLSAVEGLRVATPIFDPYVVPITCVILVILFAMQAKGTTGIGIIFGPFTLLWFAVLAILGVKEIILQPQVLAAVSPHYAVTFFLHNHYTGFLVLGSVFLVVTGGEALYADIGHFGTRPVRITWFAAVLPALLLNYFGQGALLLTDPAAVVNPFYKMAPLWALYPLVALSTVATVIASQAVISGSFSLTMQAVQLGFCPRMTIRHTSAHEMGQIYLPAVNWTLMLAAIGLVIGFESSSNLAAAYGIAVTTTMVITSLLFYVLARHVWLWPRYAIIPLTALFLIIDLAFLGANLDKVIHGGWFPILIAAAVYLLMSTWRAGRIALGKRLAKLALPTDRFMKLIEAQMPTRVPGTAVFMSSSHDSVPPSLLHNLKHNKVIHDQVLLLHVLTEPVPYVPRDQRSQVTDIGHGFHRVVLHYGFLDERDIPLALGRLPEDTLQLDPSQITYFLGRENLIVAHQPMMWRWRSRLFTMMSRNAQPATAFFNLPANRVVELGAQIEV